MGLAGREFADGFTETAKIVHGNREAEIKTAIDSVTGKRMVGWFYAAIWLAPRDDPDRALRALRTLSAFLDERHVI